VFNRGSIEAAELRVCTFGKIRFDAEVKMKIRGWNDGGIELQSMAALQAFSRFLDIPRPTLRSRLG